jgi:magnesium chelatase subunit D
LSLLLDAYQKRDKVAMVSFRKKEAYINLPPSSSIELAADHLEKMPIGGRTPLSAGLAKAYHMIENVLIRDPATRPIMIIITDGKSNVAMGEKKPMDEAMMFAMKMGLDERIKYIVVDTEPDGIVRFGLAGKLAAAANAQYCKIDDLKSDSLVSVVKGIQ